jgi:hypothetical protein
MDELLPVDATAKHSSSVVDTIAIFNLIKVFWQELDWPEAESGYTFLTRIIDVIL